MSLDAKKKALIDLSQFLSNHLNDTYSSKQQDQHQQLEVAIHQSKLHNSWFTKEFINKSLQSWSKALVQDSIEHWLDQYTFSKHASKRVAVICAGNIPLVGFHDCLCGLLCDHDLLIKYSTKDQFLLRFLLDYLIHSGAFTSEITYTNQHLKDFDAVIATGSNNTARYFEYYFKNVPSIIRKNRHSVALLTGSETQEDLNLLGQDIFTYFGLGCRNVSKLYVPKSYDFKHFFEGIFKFSDVINHHKYANNYDYNKAVYLMSNIKLFDNNFLVLKEDQGLSSPLACLFYEYYSSDAELKQLLNTQKNQLQCTVGSSHLATVGFGQTQHPQLWDYADGIDTLEFLLHL